MYRENKGTVAKNGSAGSQIRMPTVSPAKTMDSENHICDHLLTKKNGRLKSHGLRQVRGKEMLGYSMR